MTTTTEIPQVELLLQLKSVASKNQEFNLKTIKDLLVGLEQVKSGKVTEYQFG